MVDHRSDKDAVGAGDKPGTFHIQFGYPAVLCFKGFKGFYDAAGHAFKVECLGIRGVGNA